MYHYLNRFAFYKNTYGKPYLLRLEFEINVPGTCLLVADNLCRCDAWYAKDDKIEIKYDVVFKGHFEKRSTYIVKKSLIIDLNRPITETDCVELTITNTAGLTDSIQVNYTDLRHDQIKIPLP